jgi:iron(III) transport system substrate-binding protein
MTGMQVDPKFDTEAKKSVTHYAEIVSEKARPRCDMFWNNEILGTIRLQRQGLLDPYESPAAAPFAKTDKADDHTWCAFATRARVLVVNTKLVKEEDRPRSLLELTQDKWKGKVVMAQPQYGTTATQAACLFEILGPDKAKEYYRALKANGVAISPGNKQAAEWVGKGQYWVGVTDTDDAMEEKRDHPDDVVVIFPDRDAPQGRMGTLYIPNTVAIIKGCPNPEGARKLVDYLLSPEVEKKLAEGDSHQIPLNPNVKATLPPLYVKPTDKDAHPAQVDFYKAADLWDETQKFLEAEFATTP